MNRTQVAKELVKIAGGITKIAGEALNVKDDAVLQNIADKKFWGSVADAADKFIDEENLENDPYHVIFMVGIDFALNKAKGKDIWVVFNGDEGSAYFVGDKKEVIRRLENCEDKGNGK